MAVTAEPAHRSVRKVAAVYVAPALLLSGAVRSDTVPRMALVTALSDAFGGTAMKDMTCVDGTWRIALPDAGRDPDWSAREVAERLAHLVDCHVYARTEWVTVDRDEALHDPASRPRRV